MIKRCRDRIRREIEGSLVVDHSACEGKDKPPGPAALCVSIPVLHVLPEQSSVLLMEANRFFDLIRLACESSPEIYTTATS